MFYREPVLATKLFDALINQYFCIAVILRAATTIFSRLQTVQSVYRSVYGSTYWVFKDRHQTWLAFLLEMDRYPLYIDAAKQYTKKLV